PVFAWAQSSPDGGVKLLATLEQYMDACARWDAAPHDASIPTTLRRPLDDLKAQFAKARAAFWQSAAHIGGLGNTPADLDAQLQELQRLQTVTDDLQAMGKSLEVINAYKLKPIGGLDKKV